MCLSGNDEGAMFGIDSEDRQNADYGICNNLVDTFQDEWGN